MNDSTLFTLLELAYGGLEKENDFLNATVRRQDAQLNAVYTERNQCIALIARMALVLGYTAGIGEDMECDEEWRTVVYIDLPNGQVSWHIPASERSFFDFLPPYEGKWDGHDTVTKYDRVLNPGIYRTVTITVQIEGNVA